MKQPSPTTPRYTPGNVASQLGYDMSNHFTLYPILQVPNYLSLLPASHNPIQTLVPTNLSLVEQFFYAPHLSYAVFEETSLQERFVNFCPPTQIPVVQPMGISNQQGILYADGTLMTPLQVTDAFTSSGETTALQQQNMQLLYQLLQHTVVYPSINYSENVHRRVPLDNFPIIPLTEAETVTPYQGVPPQNCLCLQCFPTCMVERVPTDVPDNNFQHSSENVEGIPRVRDCPNPNYFEAAGFGNEKVEQWLTHQAHTVRESGPLVQHDHRSAVEARSHHQSEAHGFYESEASAFMQQNGYDNSRNKKRRRHRSSHPKPTPVEIHDPVPFAAESRNFLAFASSDLDEWGVDHSMGVIAQQKSSIDCCFHLSSGVQCFVKLLPSGIKFSSQQKGVSYFIDEAGVRTCFGSFKSARDISGLCRSRTGRIRNHDNACFITAFDSPLNLMRDGFRFCTPSSGLNRLQFFVKHSLVTATSDFRRSSHIFLKTYLDRFRQIIFCDGSQLRLTFHTQTAYMNYNGELSL